MNTSSTFLRPLTRRRALQAPVAALAAGGDPAPYVALCADPLVKSAVAEYLDATQGSTVNDNTVFDVLPKHFEKAYFEFHLAREGGSMTRVAEKTGLERTHLYRKLKQLGVDLARSKRNAL